jgi:hypothetical protein
MKTFFMGIRQFLLFVLFITTVHLAAPRVEAAGFPVNTSSTELTGLWFNPAQAGWGATITHQYGTMFVVLYTYEDSGSPVWYTVSNCAVSGDGCTGDLFKVTGGQPLTKPWTGTSPAVSVGNVRLAFTNINTADLNYTINGVSGSRVITRYLFASPPSGGGGGSGSFPVAYKTLRINSVTYDSSSGVGCEALVSITNTGSTSLSQIVLIFDVIKGGVSTGQTGITRSGLAPGETAQNTTGVIEKECSGFTLRFNPDASFAG